MLHFMTGPGGPAADRYYFLYEFHLIELPVTALFPAPGHGVHCWFICLCNDAICLLLWLLPALLLMCMVGASVCVCGFMFACTYLNCQINLVYSKSCLMKCSVCKDQLELGVPSAWVLIASQSSLVMMPSTLSRHEATDDTANIHTLKSTLTTTYSVFVKTWIYLM